MPYASSNSGGGGSPAPPILGYRHRQDIPAARWIITHGLGFRPAGVLVTAADGQPVEGVIIHHDAATLEIHFQVPFTGTADLS
jgi:hypothetical protein